MKYKNIFIKIRKKLVLESKVCFEKMKERGLYK